MVVPTIGSPISHNKKLGSMAATYRTPDTCASDCPLFIDGKPKCYASAGAGGGSFALAKKYGKSVQEAFVRLTTQTPYKSVVRHLVSGDVDDEYIAEANKLHKERKDLRGYGYTHDWRNRSPEEIDGWVLNASCETPEEVEKAIANGWQAVIESPKDSTLSGYRIAGRRVVSCPNQSDDRVKCSTCRLCSTSSETRPVVEFVLHGNNTKLLADIIITKRGEQNGK
jgi:hypothetical protein